LDGIGRRRNAHNNRPERWFPRLGRVPFRQRERNRAHSDQQKQVKHASNHTCSGSGVKLRFHFACVPVRKHLLPQARQRCRDFFGFHGLGCVSTVDSQGRTIWIADAQRDDGKRFVVRAERKGDRVSWSLESAIRRKEPERRPKS
jgi:hypothetical protein